MTASRNFFGFEQSNYNEAKIVIVPVPLERSTTYQKGTAFGPQAILDASEHLEFYDIETNSEPHLLGIHTMDFFLGEQTIAIEDYFYDLHDEISFILQDEKFPVIIGGEHTLSCAVVHAFVEKFPDISILHIDAHADLREEYLNDPFNHACALRRIRDFTEKTVSVGIRSMSAEEAQYCEEERPTIFFDHEIQKSGLPIEKILQSLTENVYITFDLDGLNPAEMPSVGTPEPGGLSWQQTMELFDAIFSNKNIVGMDVVELKPDKINIHSDFLAAKLIYKAIALKFYGK